MTKKVVKSRCQASVNVQPRTGLGWKLRARRLKLCLTYEQVAEAMRIHWTTLRNWELGTGAGLENPQKTRLVKKFLLGEFDEILRMKWERKDVFGEGERKLLQICQCFFHMHCYREMLHCLDKTERWMHFQERVGEIVRRNSDGR